MRACAAHCTQLLMTELQSAIDFAPRTSRSIHDRVSPFVTDLGILKTLDLPPDVMRDIR